MQRLLASGADRDTRDDKGMGALIREGDTLVCRSSNYTLRPIRPPKTMFFDVLRQKLKWGER